jgi:hypothetical protein
VFSCTPNQLSASIMNWTGGRLHRHSNAGSSLKHKQEQHFAKIKKNLLAGKRRISPRQPSLDRIRQFHGVDGNSHSKGSDTQKTFSQKEKNHINLRENTQGPHDHCADATTKSQNLRRQSHIRSHTKIEYHFSLQCVSEFQKTISTAQPRSSDP